MCAENARRINYALSGVEPAERRRLPRLYAFVFFLQIALPVLRS